MSRFTLCAAICASLYLLNTALGGPIVINEVAYDDTGAADDREFVELYNSGNVPVDISGWILIGRDATTVNPTVTVPAATIIPAGGYYVFGNAGVLNANQTIVANFLENDNESIEIRDAGSVLQDALMYETNKGQTGNLAGSGLPAEVGPGFFGNHQTIDVNAVAPLISSVSIGRYVDGRDTNNNGRDFGLRPSTPGATNSSGTMTLYTPPSPIGQTVGTDVAGLTGSFVNAKYIDPTVVDANNPNAIPAAPSSGNRAIVAWDSSGGGNGVTSNQVFSTTESGFQIYAYLDTTDQPQQFNASNVNFLGSEITIYGVGGGDALTNLTDLAGNIGLGPATLPAAETANGFTGVAWVYEKTAVSGATPATQFLYLVDANDGGDADLGGNTPLDWIILQSIDISNLASAWFDLGITIDATGAGVANFNGNTYAFNTSTNLHSGAFNVGYRENLQQGADGTPDAMLRPPTFTNVPEPASAMLLVIGLVAALTGRSRHIA